MQVEFHEPKKEYFSKLLIPKAVWLSATREKWLDNESVWKEEEKIGKDLFACSSILISIELLSIISQKKDDGRERMVSKVEERETKKIDKRKKKVWQRRATGWKAERNMDKTYLGRDAFELNAVILK